MIYFTKKQNIEKYREDRLIAYENTNFKDLSFKDFSKNIDKFILNKKSLINFDEEFYLAENDDVEHAVNEGVFECGYIHFCLHGQYEKRNWSTLDLKQTFNIKPHLGKELFAPVNCSAFYKYESDLSNYTIDKSSLMIIVPYLDDFLFFAGYISFFNDIRKVYHLFQNINIVVVNDGFNKDLVMDNEHNINVLHLSEISSIKMQAALTFCFDYETFFIAKDIFNDLDRLVYYCQDVEAGFNPLGSLYIRANKAVFLSKNLILSTRILKSYFDNKGLINAKNIYVTSPQIEKFEIKNTESKKLFFYFRPEKFNNRNLPEYIMQAVEEFCNDNTEYEIYLVGTVDTCYSFIKNKNKIYVINKLAKGQYLDLIGQCDVVVALIYSAHPGVIAFQSAASGIPTITNIFENRDEKCLKDISNKIVPFDPVKEDLLEKIYLAMKMPKGEGMFNDQFYAGNENLNFTEFIKHIIADNEE